MGFLDTIRKLTGAADAAPGAVGETATVRKIVESLERLDPERARYVAAFAFVLGRVAHADRHVSDEETRAMEAIVSRIGHLSESESVLVVEIAKAQHRLFGGTESFVVTRELGEITTRRQREELLDCLFAVSAADDSISGTEETAIRQIASELDFSHRDYVAARLKWSDKREVLRGLRRQNPPDAG